MNWKHLIWIIPLIFVLGCGLGYKLGLESIELLADMTERIDGCCISTLTYTQSQNPDCNILIVGKMQECYYNKTGDNSD